MPASIKQDRKVILSLQYLRALAAVGVVIFHQFQNVSPVFAPGKNGVGLFFIISGIIMVSLTDGRSIRPAQFFIDRLTRVAPMYWIATLVTVMLALAGLYMPSVYSHGATHLLLSCLFIPSPDEHGTMMPTLFVGWTLNYEMFFYVVFGALLLVQARYRLAALAAVFLALVLGGAVLPPQSGIGRVYTNPYLLEFLAGACLGAIFGLRLTKLPPWPTFGCVAAVALAMAGLGTAFPLLLNGSGAVLFVAACMGIERGGRMPLLPFMLTIGNASYSIYLFQQVAFDATGLALRELHYRPGLHTIPAKCLAVIVAIALGLAVYRCLERPLTRKIRRLIDGWQRARDASSAQAEATASAS
jgi:exopolysaccharide production protein ExoZ